MSVANVLSAVDSGFETGVGDWTPGLYTIIAQSATEAHTGTYSLAMTSQASGNSIAAGPMIPVLPGCLISFSGWFWTAQFAQLGQFNLVWYGSDGMTVVGNSASLSGTALPLSTWTQVSLIGQPAPSNAYWVQPQAVTTNNAIAGVSYFDDAALSWANYQTNLCPNPSFETSLAGWTGAQDNETLSLVNTYSNFTDAQTTQPEGAGTVLYGAQAMQVSTPGTYIGEGVFGPATAIPATTTGSMSCNIFGESGTLIVQAVSQATQAVLGSTIIVLEGTGWTTATVTGLTFAAGTQYYLQVVTFGSAQDLTFMIDGVMYQPEAPANPYVDGDQFQCYWSGTPELSTSYQPYQFGIVAASGFIISGAANVVSLNETFPVLNTPVLEFTVTLGPQLILSVQNPAASMTDFGIWESTDLDPAMTYSTWNNYNSLEGQVNYNRPFMVFAPPLDQFTSSGGYNWKRAAFMALGWQWLSTANSSAHVIADVQTEIVPLNGTTAAVGPRAYQQARQLQIIVKPDRLNYIVNPSFETSLANWSSISGNQTLSNSGNVPFIEGALYGNTYYGPGSNSMAIKANNSGAGGVQITINYLIPGRTYMFSAWMQPDGTSMGDIVGTCSSGSGTLTGSVGTGYGDGAYSGGPYGGETLTTLPLANTWQQLYFSFVATSDSHVLQLAPINVVSPVFPYTWFLDAVLVEDGDILNPYFDGNSGVDALWLSGGTNNLCQSFYYNQLEFARHVVIDSLNNNTPLGISYASPLYATMPTQ